PFLAGASTTAAAFEFFKMGLRTQGLRSVLSMTLSGFAAATGFILLDASEKGSVLFQPLSSEQALALGLSQEEWLAYDENLPFLNALREEAVLRTLEHVKTHPQSTEEDVLFELSSQWTTLTAESIDPAAISAARKLSDALLTQVMKNFP
ncbi:MAG: hypothetical protein KGQ59_08220, partial [Bdellovibrionales bacterium]|nr:hypothetical protein [Bdellovibrionales bacterium]